MDLWVRSQDEDILLKTHELFILKSEFKENVYFIRSSDCSLAKYNTEERALEELMHDFKEHNTKYAKNYEDICYNAIQSLQQQLKDKDEKISELELINRVSWMED